MMQKILQGNCLKTSRKRSLDVLNNPMGNVMHHLKMHKNLVVLFVHCHFSGGWRSTNKSDYIPIALRNSALDAQNSESLALTV